MWGMYLTPDNRRIVIREVREVVYTIAYCSAPRVIYVECDCGSIYGGACLALSIMVHVKQDVTFRLP